MPRPQKNFSAIVTRLAFLSLNGSAAAEKTAATILWTLENAGIKPEQVNTITAEAEELASVGREDSLTDTVE